MGVKDLIKKMEEMGKNGGEAPVITKASAPDLDTPAAAASTVPQGATAQEPQGKNIASISTAPNGSARNACEAESLEAPTSSEAQPASVASTKPSENGEAAPEDPEKKAKKVSL
jgi:hypothetical protein